MKVSVVLFSIFSTLAAASPMDVFVPPITYPTKGVVWKVGEQRNVTWDVSRAPPQITNSYGGLYLRKDGLTHMSSPLALGFDIMDAKIEIKVPNVKPAKNYQLVLFGDSGNFSPFFTITK